MKKAMKKGRTLLIGFICLIMLFTSHAAVFANENEEQGNAEVIAIAKEDLQDGHSLRYGLVCDEDGNITAEQINGSPVVLYEGSLEVNSWTGSNINFTVRLTAIGGKIKLHTGTIGIYKVTSLGLMGSVWNSMTFRQYEPLGKTTISDEYNMNTGSLDKIYIKLTNLRVTDMDNDTIALSNSQQMFKKSAFN